MTPKESEKIGFELPLISPKSSSEQLRKFSSKSWTGDGRRQVAADIVKNVKELLAGTNTDWELVLRSIHDQRLGSVQFGEAAIARRDAYSIGALVARANWSMDDPQAVYLSVKCVAYRISDKFEDLKSKMLELSLIHI